jgi:hypothetical protein
MPMDCPLGVWMTFDLFCGLKIEGLNLRRSQWDNFSGT